MVASTIQYGREIEGRYPSTSLLPSFPNGRFGKKGFRRCLFSCVEGGAFFCLDGMINSLPVSAGPMERTKGDQPDGAKPPGGHQPPEHYRANRGLTGRVSAATENGFLRSARVWTGRISYRP